MKKNIVKIISTILLFTAINYTILYYFDSMFSENNAKVATTTGNEENSTGIVINTSKDDVKFSEDDSYISYINDSTIQIVNTDNNDKISVELDTNSTLLFYKWLDDSQLIIAESKIADGNSLAVFYTFNAAIKNTVKNPILNSDNSVLKYKLKDGQIKITDLYYSKTNYRLLIKLNNDISNLVLTKNNNYVEKLDKFKSTIGNVAFLNNGATVIFNDVSKKQVRLSSGKLLSFEAIANPHLLGTVNDLVYICDNSNDITSKIYVGKVTENFKSWAVIDLLSDIKISEIFISQADGKLYVNDSLKGNIKEVTAQGYDKEYSYKGNIINIYSKGVASVSQGKLIKNTFIK